MILFIILGSIDSGSTHSCSSLPDSIHQGTYVNCSKRNLTSIPVDLPRNTTILDLSFNIISSLSNKSLNLSSLRYLQIAFNSVSGLDAGAFWLIPNIEELYLNDNNLSLDSSTYPENVFLSLQKLQKLHIHNNDIRSWGSYPDNAIGKLRNLKELKIDTFGDTQFGSGFARLQTLKHLLLGFGRCKLSHISNDTFKSFANVTLETVDLRYCPIVSIQRNAFAHFKSIKNLNLSNAFPLSPTEAVSALYGLRLSNMTSIKINNIFNYFNLVNSITLRIIDDKTCINLRDVCVERFEMTNSRILWITSTLNNEGSRFASCIKVLDLSGNDICGDPKFLLMISSMPNLISLDVSISDGVKRKSQTVRNMQVCQKTNITLGITLPEKLVNLSFSPKNVGCFYNLIFYNASSLRHLDVSYASLDRFSSKFKGLESLTYLDISGNNVAGSPVSAFDSVPQLESLIMADSNLDQRGALLRLQHKLLSLTHLHTLSISSNNLQLFDVKNLQGIGLRQFILSNNRFSEIPFDLTTTPHLSRLDLSFNSLTVLSSTEMKHLDDLAARNNISLDLEGNLLACGCKTLDFIMWLFKSNVQLHERNYPCVRDDGSVVNTSYIYEHHDEEWRRCSGGFWLSTSIILLAMFLLALGIVSIINQRKTLLVNILLRMFGFKTMLKSLTRNDFPNDAYIGYSDNDYQYICHTVRDHLENQNGIKLFLKDRDTIPGGEIAEDIIDGIDSSWKILLALSQSFLEDQWCRFIVNRVVYSSSRMPVGSIVLVLFEDVRRADIPPTLLNVVEEKHIFSAGKYRGYEERLWEEVSQSIKI
ncbi:toll-like receptor 4 [Haliotis cracherodii]|uniref:toll-like receptor 4 n=1 Tax=Haliotis cracherodii TaxID=6455 RepID=UPI0039EA754C